MTAPARGELAVGRVQWRQVAWGIALLSTVAVSDLATKEWALETLSAERTRERPPLCERDNRGLLRMQRLRRPTMVIVEDYLELKYAENCGAAFGLMAHAGPWVRRIVFGLAALAAIFVLVWTFRRGGGLAMMTGVPLVGGGAIGNLADRLRHGFVVDFIRFRVRDVFEWPTFNVADIAITVGVVLLLLDGFDASRQTSDERRPAERDPEPSTALEP